MRFGPRVALLTVLLLLAANVALVAGALGAAEPGAADTDDALQDGPPVARDSVNLTVKLRQNGDARWTVETSFRLRDADDRRAFDRLAQEFRDGTAAASYDLQTFRRASRAASNATGRQMRITRIDRSVERTPQENVTVGHLRLSFTWTNFSRVNESWLVVDEVFDTTGGTWLPGLAADQRLTIVPPDGYSPYDVPIPPQQAKFVWEGPTTFERGELAMIFTYNGPGPLNPDGGIDLSTLGLVAGLGVALVALLLGSYVYVRDGDLPDAWPVAGRTEQPDATDGGEARAATGAGAANPTPDDEEPVDLELLSDEERVEYLLRDNGGRMKQANIVRETGWSNAKVSQLLSSMDEEDRVDKLRIGRENLISLPGEDVGEFDESTGRGTG